MQPTFKAYLLGIHAILPVIMIDLESKIVDCGNEECGYDWCGYRYAEGVNGEGADCVLLQGTGVCDKNSVEIFRGDVLKDAQRNIYRVEWDSKRAQWYGLGDHLTSRVSRLSPQSFVATEICGNKYLNS